MSIIELFNRLLLSICTISTLGCIDSTTSNQIFNSIGEVKFLDKEAFAILNDNASIEVIDSGYVWAEGPLWLERNSSLLFSDVVQNRIYQWKEGEDTKVYLEPAGLSDNVPYDGREPGSNGLILNANGQLVIAQHGNRQLALMDADLANPQPKFKTIVDNYNGMRLNSPNDVIQDKQGNYYFTDPTFGLANSQKAELPHRGVYKLTNSNELHLLVADLDGPNGIALTKDEKYLLVTNSSHTKGILHEFELDHSNNSVLYRRDVYDFSTEIINHEDVLDGLTIDDRGNIYITGPQGLWILNKKYKPIARLIVPQAISNCTLSKDQKTLYLTSTDKILRVKLK